MSDMDNKTIIEKLKQQRQSIKNQISQSSQNNSSKKSSSNAGTFSSGQNLKQDSEIFQNENLQQQEEEINLMDFESIPSGEGHNKQSVSSPTNNNFIISQHNKTESLDNRVIQIENLDVKFEDVQIKKKQEKQNLNSENQILINRIYGKYGRNKYKQQVSDQNEGKIEYQKEIEILKSKINEQKVNDQKYESDKNTHIKCKQEYENNCENKQHSKKQLTDQDKEEVWKRLLSDKNAKLESRQKLKQIYEDLLFIESHPFKPSINQKQQIVSDEDVEQQNMKVEDRLKNGGQIYKQKREEKVQQKEYEESNFPFSPQINHNDKFSNVKQQLPIQDRLVNMQKEKQQRLANLAYYYEQQQEEQIKNKQPQLSELSKNLVQHKPKNVFERLQMEAEVLKLKQEQTKEHVTQMNSRECVFQPNITTKLNNNKSNDILLQSSFLSDQNFFERQDTYNKLYSQKKLQSQEQTQCSFHPRINKVSQTLMSLDEIRTCETQDEKTERLYKWDVHNRTVNQKMNKFHQDIKYDYKPKINYVSQQLTLNRVRSLDDLAYNEDGKYHIELMRDEIEQKRWEKEGATFHPETYSKTTEKFLNLSSRYSQNNCWSNVKDEQQIKTQKYKAKLKQKEEKTQKKCTFSPEISRNRVSKNSKLHIINGLENYMDNRIQCYIQESEKIKAYDKMFNLHQKYDQKRHASPTMPQPFQLSQQQKKYGYKK